MNGNGCTIGSRLLVHLSCYSRFKEEYVCPPEMTQDGMSQRLGISRAHAALELKRLAKRNHVEHRLAHVVKAKTRRKVYHLTPAGERMANELKDGARRKRIKLLDNNGGGECTGQEALRMLCSQGLTESEAFSRILVSEALPVVNACNKGQASPGHEWLVGRGAENARLARWFNTPGKALCVLTGDDGIGKTTVACCLQSVAPEPSLHKAVMPLQSVRSLLMMIAGDLRNRERMHLAGLLQVEEFEPMEAVIALAEDMAGGLLILDDVHNSPEIEEFAALFLTMNDWPLKVLLVSRRKPGFC